jgi:hypothetical protein
VQKLSKNRSALDENHVLVVTTNSNERRKMLEILDRYQNLTTGSSKRRAFLGHAGDCLVVVLDGDGGYASGDAATRFASEYLMEANYPRPALVVIGGVCWGNPQHVQIGDVIVSGSIQSANRSTAREDGSEAKFYHFKSSLNVDALLSTVEPKPMCGELVSLEVRLSDEKARDVLLSQCPTVLGGEMEGFALVPQCKNTPWLVIKAVSDFATVIEGREEQADAASRAAAVVKTLIGEFQAARRPDLSEKTKTDATNFIHALNDKRIAISLDHFDPSDSRFTAVLEDSFSERLSAAISLLTNAIAVDAKLADDLASLLLEVASNAFRHGRARSVWIECRVSGVEYRDDATAFDLPSLRDSGRGGNFSYKQFLSRHVDTGHVEIESSTADKGNSIRVHVPHEIADLRNIVDQCSASFNRSALLQGRPALNWLPQCQTVFVDVDSLVMMSVVFDVCDEIAAPVHAGLKFILLCSDVDRLAAIRTRYSKAVSSMQIRFVPAP